jgi:hypothetical protein
MRTAFVGTRHLNCPEKLVARAFSRRTMFSFIRPKADILRKDLAEAKGTNAWANLRNVKLAKLEEGLREAIDAFDELFYENELARQVFLHTDHPADLVGSLDVLRDLHEFVRRSRDVMPTKVKAPRLPVWMRQVARDVWEFDKNRRDVYIGLMELLCPKERFDLVRKRAKRLWKETINSSKTSN